MKMIAEYLEHAGRFEQKAEEATDRKFKEGMLRQAAAYRKLAERRAEILNVPILAGVCTTISLLSALFAAALWFMSAEVTIPAPGHFPIIVHPPDPLTAVPGDTLVGVGNSPKLQEWTAAVAEAFGQQSKLSGSAAVATSVAIFFEVFAILFRAARLPRLLRLASRMWIAR